MYCVGKEQPRQRETMYVKGAKLKSRQLRTEKGLVCLETVQKGRVSWYRGQIMGLENATHEMDGVFMFLFRQPQDIAECLKQRRDMMTLKLSRANFEYCSEHELVVWKGQRMNYANLLGGLVIGKLVRSDWIVNIVGMNKQWG